MHLQLSHINGCFLIQDDGGKRNNNDDLFPILLVCHSGIALEVLSPPQHSVVIWTNNQRGCGRNRAGVEADGWDRIMFLEGSVNGLLLYFDSFKIRDRGWIGLETSTTCLRLDILWVGNTSNYTHSRSCGKTLPCLWHFLLRGWFKT